MIGHQKEIRKEESSYLSNSSVGFQQIYLRYPYKKRTYATALPYVSVEENTDTEFSLTYQQWRTIIDTYLENLVLYLAAGKVYRFHSGMGEFQIMKYKSKKPTNNLDFPAILKHYMEKEGLDMRAAQRYIKSLPKEEKVMWKHKNKHTEGWKWTPVWLKSGYQFAFKHHWMFSFSRKHSWRKIEQLFKEDRSLIHRINQSPGFKRI